MSTQPYTLSLHDALPICPSRSTVTCACSQPPVGTEEDGPKPQISTYMARPRPTRRPSALAASRSAFSSLDRKSTRLNSSHLGISYAVFCLKKKHYNSE